jgi:hypothetical protein
MGDLEKQLRDQEVRNIISKLKAGRTLTARESQLASDYARELSGGSRYLTGAEIGKLLGISRQGGDKKVRAGCLVRSFEELVEWERANNRHTGAGAGIIEARRQKIELETERLRLRIKIDRGQMIDRERVREAGVAAGAALVAELSVLANELPGQLAGLGELDIRDRLLARIDILVRSFRDRIENLKFDDEAESAD